MGMTEEQLIEKRNNLTIELGTILINEDIEMIGGAIVGLAIVTAGRFDSLEKSLNYINEIMVGLENCKYMFETEELRLYVNEQFKDKEQSKAKE